MKKKFMLKLMLSAIMLLGISGGLMAQGAVISRETKAQGATVLYTIQTGNLHATAVKYQNEFLPQAEIGDLKIDAVTGVATFNASADLTPEKLKMHVESYLVNLTNYARAHGENIPSMEEKPLVVQPAFNAAVRADGKPAEQQKQINKN